jgi:MYXO-CTERM domain-containing protein
VFTSSLEDLPVARGTYVVHEDSNVLCNKDMAIVVLNRSVPNVTPLPVRVSAALTPGEQVRAIGYGLNDVGLPTGTRLRRENVPVLAMGPGISASRTSLGNREFEAGTSFCQGDSGGPAISEVTGAVVGVVSRGRADCNTENGNVYTSTAGFTTLFQKAEELSGSVVTHEQGAATGDQAVASDTTAMTGTLPLVTSNLQSDGNSHEGCSISPSQPIRSAGPLAGWTMLAGVALLLRRRQRRSTP